MNDILAGDLIALMRERLATLAPESLEIEDESARHAGTKAPKAAAATIG